MKTTRRDDGLRDARKTLKAIIVGIISMAFAESILGAIISERPIGFILGEVLGTIGAIAYMYNLYATLDVALSMDEGSAVKYSRRKAVFRLLLLAMVIFISFLFMEYVSVIGTFLGLMNIKFGVYLVPLAHEYKSRRTNKEDVKEGET